MRARSVDGYLDWVSANLYADGELVDDRLGRAVDQRNYERVQGYVADAVTRGGTSITVAPAVASLVIAPTVLSGVDLDAAVMREEIFGPVLPVLTFRDVSTVVDAVREDGKPLAMYLFSEDDAFIETMLEHTSSGGVTINGWALHSSDTGLPFGGVGTSGIGRYHGVHGFLEMSHARSVFMAAPTKG
jgi:aldehyde dehydrogenase (NAD+)